MRCLGTSCTGVSGHRSRFRLRLVVPTRIQLEIPEQLSVGRGDPHLAVLDQDEDVASLVAPADADVVQPSAVAQGDSNIRSLPGSVVPTTGVTIETPLSYSAGSAGHKDRPTEALADTPIL